MKTVNPFLVLALLFTAGAWVWFQSQGLSGAKNPENAGQEISASKGKTSQAKMVQVPVVIKEIVLPKKAEVKKPAAPKKESVHKKESVAKKENFQNTGNKASDGKYKAGVVPNLFAAYEMPVKEYLLYMKSRGGRVFIYDKAKDGFICEIVEDGVFVTPSNISQMSQRSRRITSDFPRSKEVLNKAEESYGAGDYEVLLLLPGRLEESIYENITRIISERGLKMEDVETVFISYRRNAASVSVYIEKVTGGFGTRKIGEIFKL